MGNCSYKVDTSARDMSGLKTIRGTLVLSSSYSNTAGDSLNFTNDFKSSCIPTVILGSDDGYLLKQTPARNAESQLIQAYYMSTAINSAYGALGQVVNATNLSAVNVTFTATGNPY